MTILKKITAVMLAGVMAASLAVSANATHTSPSGQKCNSTIYYLGHLYSAGSSKAPHGLDCTITYYAYRHSKSCACGYSYGEGPMYQCTEEHSTCGSYKRDCTVAFS